jgi:hypothetical protein
MPAPEPDRDRFSVPMCTIFCVSPGYDHGGCGLVAAVEVGTVDAESELYRTRTSLTSTVPVRVDDAQRRTASCAVSDGQLSIG